MKIRTMSPPTESHKRILLEFFRNGQELIDSYKPNIPVCWKCGNPPTIKLNVEKQHVTMKMIITGNNPNGELVWSKTSLTDLDQTQPPNHSTEYWCSGCYDKLQDRRQTKWLKWRKENGFDMLLD